tara:strand:- start:311 stop:502 length:192 start_codon:yes stop_codon:yes gene_type:complete
MKRLVSIFLLPMFLLIIISCEDDALLSPQNDDSESDGGSYGNLSLPGDSDEDLSKIKNNPEIF